MNGFEDRKSVHAHLQIYDLLAKVGEAAQSQPYLQDAIKAAQKAGDEFEGLAAAYQSSHPTPAFVTHALEATEAEDVRAQKAPRRFNIHRYQSVLESARSERIKQQRGQQPITIRQFAEGGCDERSMVKGKGRAYAGVVGAFQKSSTWERFGPIRKVGVTSAWHSTHRVGV